MGQASGLGSMLWLGVSFLTSYGHVSNRNLGRCVCICSYQLMCVCVFLPARVMSPTAISAEASAHDTPPDPPTCSHTHTHTHTPSTNATDPRHSPLLSPQLGTRHAFTRCMRALSPRVPRCRHRAGARVAWYVGFGFRLEAWHTPYRTCMRALRPHEWIFLLVLRPSPCAPMPLSPQLSPSPCLWHLI